MSAAAGLAGASILLTPFAVFASALLPPPARSVDFLFDVVGDDPPAVDEIAAAAAAAAEGEASSVW